MRHSATVRLSEDSQRQPRLGEGFLMARVFRFRGANLSKTDQLPGSVQDLQG